MGLVLWHVTMSLDGFIAGPGDAMDWVFRPRSGGPNDTVAEVIASTGALVVGRRTYEVEDRSRGGFYGDAWTGPFFVLTHQAPASAPAWMTGTFVNDGIEDAVTRADGSRREERRHLRRQRRPAVPRPRAPRRDPRPSGCPSCWATVSGSSVAPAPHQSRWRRSASRRLDR
jgi:hypothetical protein